MNLLDVRYFLVFLAVRYFLPVLLTRISWVIVTAFEPFDMKQAFKPAA